MKTERPMKTWPKYARHIKRVKSLDCEESWKSIREKYVNMQVKNWGKVLKRYKNRKKKCNGQITNVKKKPTSVLVKEIQVKTWWETPINNGKIDWFPWNCWPKKNCTMWELWVKFYLRKNDYSLGYNTSDGSEKLLQGGSGEVSIYVILMKGEYMQSNICSFQKVSASHKKQMSLWRILVLF